jgi:arylsulfotransferase ASST
VSGGPSTTHHVRCLPLDFPTFTAEKSRPTQSEWYIVTPSLGSAPAGTNNDYVTIFDSNGIPVWWMLSSQNSPLDAKLLPNGNIIWLHLNRATAEEHRIDGTLVRNLSSVGPGADHHDILLLSNGNYLMAKYYNRPGVDLTFCGGSANATIQDNQIQEVTPTGQLVWSWNAYDHLPLPSELSPQWYSSCTQGFPDVYHFNSFEVDGDGLVISMRHQDAVYRIDKATGAVDWKLGGTTTADSLTAVNDPAATSGTGIFGGQHDARIYGDGTLTLHDNGSRRSRPARSLRYSIDEAANTATLLEDVRDPSPPSSGCCGGSRKLPGGNWVMSWGQQPLVTELTPAGTRVYKLTFVGGLFSYRANPVPFGTLSASAVRGGMDTMHPR